MSVYRTKHLRPIGLLIVLVACLHLLILTHTYEPETSEPPMAAAHSLLLDLGATYPHWDRAPRNLYGLWAAYTPRMVGAFGECDPRASYCTPVLRVLRDLFAELENGHTAVVVDADSASPPIGIKKVADGVAITWVDADAIRGCDLSPGMRVVAVDGVDVHRAAAKAPRWKRAASSKGNAEALAYARLLQGPADEVIEITVRDHAGHKCSTELLRVLYWDGEDDAEQEDLVVQELSDGIGYLRVPGFHGASLPVRLSGAVHGLSGARGLIVDLRANFGGDARTADGLAAHFLQSRTILGTDCLADCELDGTCTETCEDRVVEPHAVTYEGKVAVLIDEFTSSAAEALAYALCRTGTGRCFGRPTAGETDYCMLQHIPGGLVSIANARFFPAIGPEIQGHGVEPDVTIPLTVEDIRLGQDPVREAAERWIQQPLGNAG